MKDGELGKRNSNLDYFAVLAVGEDAPEAEVERRYDELARLLASPAIPASLRAWASRQTELVDEAYAALADPEQRAEIPRSRDARERGPAVEAPARGSGVRRRRAGKGRATGGGIQTPADRGFLARLHLKSAALPAALGFVLGMVALAATLVGLNGGLNGLQGKVGEAKVQQQQAAPEQPVAQEQQAAEFAPYSTRVVQLMQTVQQDAGNKEALLELGQFFFAAKQWQPAIDWLAKLVAVDPSNIQAWTAIGTASYNLGRIDQAKAIWQKALTMAPNDPQLHLSMGVAYAYGKPQDLAAATKEWQTVVSLVPSDSQHAKAAQAYLQAAEKSIAAAAAAASQSAEGGQ